MRSETKPSQDEEKNGQEPLLPPIQPVIDFGSVVIKNSRAAIHCLTIAGQIEGHMQLPNTQKATKYEHVLPLLAYLEESDDIDGVLFLLNTVGGDVEAGLAIAELISGMKKPTVSLVLGGGHSIGVPLAVAPKRSLIAPSASMTVHPIRTNGTLIAAPQTYHYFDRLQERIVRFVTKNSGISEKKLLALMLAAEDMAADVVGDGKPRLHVAAAGVEEQQHAVDLLALVERREQRQNVLILGRFHGIGQKAVALDLPDDCQAVDRAARGARGHGSHIHDGLHGRRLLERRPLLLILVRLCRFRHGASLLFSHKVGFAEK